MTKENFVDSLVDYFEKKTSLTMTNISSEEDILLCSSLDSFYGKYYDYGFCVFGILYLREDGYDSIVICTIDKDSEDIQCWEEIENSPNLFKVCNTLVSTAKNKIDEVLQVMEEDYL